MLYSLIEIQMCQIIINQSQFYLQIQKADSLKQSDEAKGGWFSGWFGGSKPKSGDASADLDICMY